MEDREIIKALNLCSTLSQGCSECPYLGREDCVADSAKDAIDLIQRQQERIERLKDNLDAVLKERADHTEAIKEFAEKAVHELTANYSDEYCHWIDVTIDSLVKEMVGGSDDR